MSSQTQTFRDRFVNYVTAYQAGYTAPPAPAPSQKPGGNTSSTQKTALVRKERYNDPKMRQSTTNHK